MRVLHDLREARIPEVLKTHHRDADEDRFSAMLTRSVRAGLMRDRQAAALSSKYVDAVNSGQTQEQFMSEMRIVPNADATLGVENFDQYPSAKRNQLQRAKWTKISLMLSDQLSRRPYNVKVIASANPEMLTKAPSAYKTAKYTELVSAWKYAQARVNTLRAGRAAVWDDLSPAQRRSTERSKVARKNAQRESRLEKNRIGFDEDEMHDATLHTRSTIEAATIMRDTYLLVQSRDREMSTEQLTERAHRKYPSASAGVIETAVRVAMNRREFLRVTGMTANRENFNRYLKGVSSGMLPTISGATLQDLFIGWDASESQREAAKLRLLRQGVEPNPGPSRPREEPGVWMTTVTYHHAPVTGDVAPPAPASAGSAPRQSDFDVWACDDDESMVAVSQDTTETAPEHNDYPIEYKDPGHGTHYSCAPGEKTEEPVTIGVNDFHSEWFTTTNDKFSYTPDPRKFRTAPRRSNWKTWTAASAAGAFVVLGSFIDRFGVHGRVAPLSLFASAFALGIVSYSIYTPRDDFEIFEEPVLPQYHWQLTATQSKTRNPDFDVRSYHHRTDVIKAQPRMMHVVAQLRRVSFTDDGGIKTGPWRTLIDTDTDVHALMAYAQPFTGDTIQAFREFINSWVVQAGMSRGMNIDTVHRIPAMNALPIMAVALTTPHLSMPLK